MTTATTEAPVVVCWADDFLIRRIEHCPVCKKRRRHVLRSRGWYGPIITCCGCGDSWSEEGRMPRPFQRGWRAKAIAKARREWDAAGPYDPAAHSRWLREQMGEPEQQIGDVPTGGLL